jgi:hypothetical protein
MLFFANKKKIHYKKKEKCVWYIVFHVPGSMMQDIVYEMFTS